MDILKMIHQLEQLRRGYEDDMESTYRLIHSRIEKMNQLRQDPHLLEQAEVLLKSEEENLRQLQTTMERMEMSLKHIEKLIDTLQMMLPANPPTL